MLTSDCALLIEPSEALSCSCNCFMFSLLNYIQLKELLNTI